jgi:hypothetical protein
MVTTTIQRHLRSEGGQECKRPHQAALAAQKASSPSKSNPLSAFRTTGASGGSPAQSAGGQYTIENGGGNLNGHNGNGIGHHVGDSNSSAYDSEGSSGLRSVQATPSSGPAPSLAAV